MTVRYKSHSVCFCGSENTASRYAIPQARRRTNPSGMAMNFARCESAILPGPFPFPGLTLPRASLAARAAAVATSGEEEALALSFARAKRYRTDVATQQRTSGTYTEPSLQNGYSVERKHQGAEGSSNTMCGWTTKSATRKSAG